MGNSHEIGIFQHLETTLLKVYFSEFSRCKSLECTFPKLFPSFGPTHGWWGRGQHVLKISWSTPMTVICHRCGAQKLSHNDDHHCCGPQKVSHNADWLSLPWFIKKELLRSHNKFLDWGVRSSMTTQPDNVKDTSIGRSTINGKLYWYSWYCFLMKYVVS